MTSLTVAAMTAQELSDAYENIIVAERELNRQVFIGRFQREWVDFLRLANDRRLLDTEVARRAALVQAV